MTWAGHGTARQGEAGRGRALFMSETNGKTRSMFEVSIDTKLAFERLQRCTPDEIVSYKELTELLGRDAQTAGYHNIAQARNMLLRGEGGTPMAFSAVVGVGVKRMADGDLANSGRHYAARIRRTSKRGMQTLAAVSDFDALPNESKIAHNAMVSLLGAIALASKEKSIQKIEIAVDKEQEKLSFAKTLALFRG